jgi:creatinine amidohydrolase
MAASKTVDLSGAHGNWLESFPWTRLADAPAPAVSKPLFNLPLLRASNPKVARSMLGDGSFGGDYARPDKVMLELWQQGVEETRAAFEGVLSRGW